ncbi:MAG: argininosuccinate lyase [Chloroflexota bacterium]|nr:argininosuccinate lyase [Chloroflexota bacterium]
MVLDTTGASKAWGGRFATSPDKRLEAFNASVTFDVRLIREDIRASIAHTRMLGTQGIISAAEAEAIIDGLWTILDEVDQDAFALTIEDEDVHTGVERRLGELIGSTSGKLHTGRSRNDQVANDFRFWTRGALVEIAHGLVAFAGALLDVAGRYPDAVMPGYTHLQRAQPIMLGHHMLAYVEMTLRDLDRVQDVHQRTNVLALGSGALAGTSYPIDRNAVADELGFAGITPNSLDAVSDRDFVLDALFTCSVIAVHISRLSEEIILWTSGEFRFAELDDAFSTGSSIMPQKKNADIAELARGKSGRVFGNLLGLLTALKGLPLAYNKDMQEDKEGLFDSVDTVVAILDVFPPMLMSMRFDEERLAAAAVADFTLATDAADLLARHGVPFREAHGVVGQLVATCIREGKTFADLSDDEWAAVHPVFANERPPLDARASATIRDIAGGTAPRQVALQMAAAADRLRTIKDWCDRERERDLALFQRI